MATIHLFVYGTLRKNENHHHYLTKCPLIAEQAWINGVMVETSEGYPTVELSEKPSERVYGELYAVSTEQLETIDVLKGYKENDKHSLSVRKKVLVHTDQGEQQGLIFVSLDKTLQQEVIKASDWKLYNLQRNAPKTFYYFAYGSCMDTERFMKAGVDHFFEDVVGVGMLQGYQMGYYFYAPDGNRADIVEGSGETEGIVYQLPIEAMDYLFKREGVTVGHYRPTFVNVTIDGTIYKDVLTFHVYDKNPQSAPPLFYAREILRAAEGRLSYKYVQHLKDEIKKLGVVN
ncbi:gamma-glutamylcyclotransferase [Cytobacillus sp. Sa5YUA1]|uniref:Gamma-glutamylcyclotransferase n=1 Tax=Cytobacillus stercorigallinarum TaxID=2762240 RepID=A0ABR8QQF6_9BACI|nr:gamma-glutamylcyclotransferase family protein [Cytobacillus stercorigallinarum]MBD7937733.1 gamma-glutamylcyclotransferase [Cytobacillus stercorigallinarum]